MIALKLHFINFHLHSIVVQKSQVYIDLVVVMYKKA